MKKKIVALVSMIFLMFIVPFTVSAMEYQHELKTKKMVFAWTIEGEQIHVKVSAGTTGWVGIGFGPEKAMQGANIIIGYFSEKKGAKVEDHYGDRKTGHKSDVKMGGTNDIVNPSAVEKDGVTTITFSFPLKSADKWDKPISTAGMTRIMLAHGKGKDSLKTRHPYRTVWDVDLSSGESKKIK